VIRSVVRILALLLLLGAVVPLHAYALPYEGYSYDYWRQEIPAPVAYVPVESISGSAVGAGNFRSPYDIYVRNDVLYVSDTGNNRIVVINERMELVRVIDSFDNDGALDTFNSQSGIFVSNDYKLYIADTGNNRVVVLDENDELVMLYEQPEDELIADNFVFIPLRVAVDAAGKLYVVARNAFEGIMCFDTDGSFFSYFGTIRVSVNPIDYFWRLIATREQRSKMILFIPTEFSSIDIDDEGFIFATSFDQNQEQMVRRLNPKGDDVLINYNANSTIRRQVRGDFVFVNPSVFTDIKTRGHGLYSVIDSTRGRIFTYDSEGNLLYVFGGSGSILGMFRTPQAIEEMNGRMLVLDQATGEIVVFQPTYYGSLINKAVGLRYEGKESESVAVWEELLLIDSKFEIAYDGIGKSLLSNGENRAAMEYFAKTRNKDYYSLALRRYRSEVMNDYIAILLSLIFIGAFVYIAVKIYRVAAKKPKKARAGLRLFEKYPLSLLRRPFESFYIIKTQQTGRMRHVFIILFLFWVSYSFNRQYSSLLVNDNDLDRMNSLVDLSGIIAIYFLWCLGNWSVTSLANGKGTFKEIMIASANALLPIILTWIPISLISNVLILEESIFYYLVISISIIVSALLMFIGMLTVHEYTPAKTVGTIFLTLISMLLIVFLFILALSLLQQMWLFGKSVYIELTYS
jgi:hypothetical protein